MNIIFNSDGNKLLRFAYVIFLVALVYVSNPLDQFSGIISSIDSPFVPAPNSIADNNDIVAIVEGILTIGLNLRVLSSMAAVDYESVHVSCCLINIGKKSRIIRFIGGEIEEARLNLTDVTRQIQIGC